MNYILGEAGRPVECESAIEWGQWFGTADRSVVATDIGDVRVSTIFLGIDHAWGVGVPVLWETMIFGGAHDGYQERFTTRGGAVDGHHRAVAIVNGTGDPHVKD